MKAEITFSQVWYNHSLMNFFFSTQSEKTLDEFMERAKESPSEICEIIEDYADTHDVDLDGIEEMFYDETVEELAEEFGIEIVREEEDEDE